VPDTPTDPAAIITRTRDSAIAYGKELLHALSADLRQGELSQLAEIWDMLPYHVGVVATANFALTHATAPTPPSLQQREPSVPEYIISSRFLTECYTYLTGDSRGFERLHLVTGIALNENRYTLDHMERVALSRQSAIGAQADQQAFTRALIELSEWGHALHGIFHSHPGTGARATLPSLDKDLPTHQRLENGDYPLIGAIFVKSGHVRFFSTNRPFTVSIYGKGVTPVSGDEHVYKIQTTPGRGVSYETLEAEE